MGNGQTNEWADNLKSKCTRDRRLDKREENKHFSKALQSQPLTIDPKAIHQLCTARYIGCHTAVAPCIRKLGSLNMKNSSIS